jgi:hypothetical protein
LIIAAVLVLAGALFAIRKYTASNGFDSRISNDPSVNKLTEARPAATETPLGGSVRGSGNADGLDVGVAHVVPAPATTGDKPDPGTRYVEIDLSVRNTGKDLAVVVGTFYYRTADGKLLNTATSTGKGPDYPGKDVSVAGKEPLEALSLDAGEADDSHYLLYQVPVDGKTGKLVWYEGYYDTGSTRLAIFNLE